MAQNSDKKEAPAHVPHALSATEIVARLATLDGWRLQGDGDHVAIEKTFTFADYHRTVGFVNALAFIAQRMNHHPELVVRYGSCSVRWNTHDVHALSAIDFECAAATDRLLA